MPYRLPKYVTTVLVDLNEQAVMQTWQMLPGAAARLNTLLDEQGITDRRWYHDHVWRRAGLVVSAGAPPLSNGVTVELTGNVPVGNRSPAADGRAGTHQTERGEMKFEREEDGRWVIYGMFGAEWGEIALSGDEWLVISYSPLDNEDAAALDTIVAKLRELNHEPRMVVLDLETAEVLLHNYLFDSPSDKHTDSLAAAIEAAKRESMSLR